MPYTLLQEQWFVKKLEHFFQLQSYYEITALYLCHNNDALSMYN